MGLEQMVFDFPFVRRPLVQAGVMPGVGDDGPFRPVRCHGLDGKQHQRPKRGNKHLAQGIALGTRATVMFALQGQKPYLFH